MKFLTQEYRTTTLSLALVIGGMFSLPQLGKSPLGLSYFLIWASVLGFVGFFPLAHRSVATLKLNKTITALCSAALALVVPLGAVVASLIAHKIA